MRPESLKLLKDMADAADGISTIVSTRSLPEFQGDLQLRWAVERGFEIIGEALTQLRKLDPQTAESLTHWRSIIGFRNVLIHGYAIVNPARTWDTAVTFLPLLRAELARLIA